MFNPVDYNYPIREIVHPSAWIGLEKYIPDIINKLNIETKAALEFGVDYGYSSEVFSNIFDKCTGVDAFLSDVHLGHEQGDEFYNRVKDAFNNTNVEIIRSSFEDFIKDNNNHYNLIHIDIVHHYQPTYDCAEWAIDHGDVVLLHDTLSYGLTKVCEDLSEKYNLNYINIEPHSGLGVLFKKSILDLSTLSAVE